MDDKTPSPRAPNAVMSGDALPQENLLKTPANVADAPLTVSIKRTIELTSLGKTSVTRLIREGKLDVTRLGRRTLVHMSSVQALLGTSQAQ